MRSFGYHIQGGQYLGQTLKMTIEAGYTAAQIFLGPPQTARMSTFSMPELLLFQKVKIESGIKVFVHAPYVLHAFAKPDNKLRNNEAIKKMWEFSADMGMDGFVVHMGGTKHYNGGTREYCDIAIELMETLHSSSRWTVEAPPILFENCANGNDMSGHLPTICDLLDELTNLRYNVGLCLDTLHAWAWGYDYTDLEVLKRVTDPQVFKHLKLIHLNSAPAKVVCGGKYDRHECLSRGTIPVESFGYLLSKFPDIPTIVERENPVDVLGDWEIVKLADESHRMSLIEQGE